ncbi:MAG: hypothetical protein KBG00_11560 [Rhodoferax sp.]|jgi:hypothetical protein|nr:hypothetical protein [Rhodoferax sp.]
MLQHHADASTTPDVAVTNPIDDYLQFAQISQEPGEVGVGLGANNPAIDDYIQAAGVDSASVPHTTPDLPPTEILLDTEHSGTAGALPHDTSADDAAFNTVPIDLPDLPPDDPQHHGM